MTLSDHDLDTVAETVWGEARGERLEGQIAVAWVVRNRAAHPAWWGHTPAEVCLRAYQFSCRNPGDPNAAKLADPALKEDRTFRFIRQLVAEVFADKHPDPTGGATHYKVWNTRASWDRAAEALEPVRIGAHLFFNLGPSA